MITIQEHNNSSKPNPTDFLKALALSHLSEILKESVAVPGSYGRGSIIKSLEENRNKAHAEEAAYLKKIALNDSNLAKKHAAFFDFLASNSYEKLKEIIISPPKELEVLRNSINAKFGLDLFYNIASQAQSAFGALLSERIFNYKKYRNSSFCASQMAKLGFLRARCPYCGYMLVEVIQVKPTDPKGKKDKALLDLDHYYSKSQNPYLAISFFNLIPSCHSCNSSYKGDKAFELDTHLHPYFESFDDFYVFSTKASKGRVSDTIELNLRRGVSRKLMNHVIFDLQKRYENAKDELLQIEYDYEDGWAKWKDVDPVAFKEYMLKGFPKSKLDLLRVEGAKAKRDILKSVDFAGVFSAY
jgi:hypothetical protein